MSVSFICLFTILNLLFFVSTNFDEEVGKLCFVSLIYRHGDRAPIGSYPTDPHGDVCCWPNGWGQLTKLGKLQQYELGKWIRNRYWDFLPAKYNSSDIYVRSTDVDRTLISAYCNLAGLYECWDDEGNDGLTWQPIPVHTMPVTMDSVLAAHKCCPEYELLYTEVMNSDEVVSFNDCYEDVFANLSEKSGLNIKSVKDCVFLYSTLNIQHLHGYSLPEWTKNYFPEPLKEISEYAFKLSCLTTPLKRLKCGPLLKEIIQLMEDKQMEKISQKIWMYSAHDTTLANLLQCLNLYDGAIPPYTATVILELYKSEDNEYYVIIFYKTPTTLRALKIPDCGRVCPLQTFKKIMSPVIPVDWEQECVSRCQC